MKITRQADYAIRAVRYLSNQEMDKNIATSKVAKEMKIPPPSSPRSSPNFTLPGF